MTPSFRRALLIGAGVVALAVLVAGLSPHLIPTGDQATFVLLGRSLAAGEGYADTFRPDAPPHTKFPPLLPLLVAPFASGALATQDFLACQAIVLALGLLGAFFAYKLFRPGGAGVALLVSSLFLFNARYYVTSHTLMSEVPFITASLGALLALRSAAKEERILSRPALLAALALSAATLARTVGIVLALSGALFLILGVESRGPLAFRLRKAAAVAFLPVATLAAWLVRNNVVAGRATEYLSQIGAANPEAAEAGALTAMGFADRLWNGFKDYFFQTGDLLYLGDQIRGLGVAAETAELFVLAIAIACIVAAYIPLLISGRGPVELWVFFYVGAIVVYPYRNYRYALPLLPFFLHYLYIGLGRLVAPARWKTAFRAVALGGIGLVNALAIGVFLTEGDRHDFGAHRIAGVPAADFYRKGYGELFRAAGYARENLPPDAVVFTDKPEYFAAWSGRKTVPYPGTIDPGNIVADALARGAGYLLSDNLTNRDLAKRRDLLEKDFAEVWRDGGTVLWKRR